MYIYRSSVGELPSDVIVGRLSGPATEPTVRNHDRPITVSRALFREVLLESPEVEDLLENPSHVRKLHERLLRRVSMSKVPRRPTLAELPMPRFGSEYLLKSVMEE